MAGFPLLRPGLLLYDRGLSPLCTQSLLPVFRVYYIYSINFQIDRQKGRQADRQTGRQAGRRAGRNTDRRRQTETNKDREDREDREDSRQADRQTGRQADRQTGRQADRQAGRQAGRQADKQRAKKQVDRYPPKRAVLFAATSMSPQMQVFRAFRTIVYDHHTSNDSNGRNDSNTTSGSSMDCVGV